MKMRNYCVVIMGNTDNVKIEIEKVSDSETNILDAKGVVIATFSSFVEPNEMSEWFKLNNRSFLVFDLDPKSSGYNITKKEIHKGLFGFLEKNDENELDKKVDEFMKSVRKNKFSGGTMTYSTAKDKISDADIVTDIITESDIEKMTTTEREILLNKIMDNGIENMSENDKKILPLLAK